MEGTQSLLSMTEHPCAVHANPLYFNDSNGTHVSCLDDRTYRDFAKSQGIDVSQKSRGELAESLHRRYPECNNNEHCQLKRARANEPLQFYKTTKEPEVNNWLYNVDIDRAMNPYMKKYRDFIFLGAFPIDFDASKQNISPHWYNVCTPVRELDIGSLVQRGITRIGAVFNTQPHNQGGEHWVCTFIDVLHKRMYYYNSTGGSAPSEILTLRDKVLRQTNRLGHAVTFDQNTVKNQESSSECGVFCLWFINGMLEHKNFQDMVQRAPDDNWMKHVGRRAFFLHDNVQVRFRGGRLEAIPDNNIRYRLRG